MYKLYTTLWKKPHAIPTSNELNMYVLNLSRNTKKAEKHKIFSFDIPTLRDYKSMNINSKMTKL